MQKPHGRTHRSAVVRGGFYAMVVAAAVGCSSQTASVPGATATIVMPTVTEAAPRSYPGLHNVVAYHENFISGSVPEGDAGFDSLGAMGVKTIISVDGAAPELEPARARNIRYIHLPIAYNGFDEARRLELARAVRDALRDGPVYIHCHHGKHRSAGAAATVAATLGWMSPAEGVERMKVSGTAPNYKGLYACAADATIVSMAALDAVANTFPERSAPQGLIKSMVEIDEILDNLKAIEKAGWRVPVDHPDLVPVAEAARLTDLFRHANESPEAKRHSADFGAMLTSASDATQRIEDLLGSPLPDTAKLAENFKLVSVSCKDCHAKYRD